MSVEKFSQDFLENVLLDAEANGEFHENVFTQHFLEYLVEADECIEPQICHYKKPGMKLNAFDLHEDNDTLLIFVSVFDNLSYNRKVSKKTLGDEFERGKRYFEKAIKGFGSTMEESNEIFDASNLIYTLRNDLKHVKIYILTNGIAVPEIFPDKKLGNITLSYHVWDIERLYQFSNNEGGREDLVIDFDKEFGGAIKCLKVTKENEVYNAYLAIIPGDVIAKIYEKWGQRLIERNIRSYLQATGNVNKGMRDTIRDNPYMFMAYNNGISTTAESASYIDHGDGSIDLISLTGWQIVNGGQTTASLYQALKSKNDLSDVFVQMKLTILKDSESTNTIVPLISRYANSQTKINISDFNSNDSFHIELEKHSREIWAPNKDIRGKATTKWFYERARGQYMVELNRLNTPKQKLEFKNQHPNSQKLVKTAVAKYEMSWLQEPHIVSRGGETNFAQLTIKISNEPASFIPNEQYFKRMIAKAILFQTCDGIVNRLDFGGYKANIVTYSIAALSYLVSDKINLDLIWKKQIVSTDIQKALNKIAAFVFEHITNPPVAGTNITQFCKQEICWSNLKSKIGQLKLSIADHEEESVIETEEGNIKVESMIASTSETDQIFTAASDVWYDLFKWARANNYFNVWERNFIYSIGRIILDGKQLTNRQLVQAKKVYSDAILLGFKN